MHRASRSSDAGRVLTPFSSEPLAALSGIRHGFFGRKGGVSQGIYASLNCGYGSGDEPLLVEENRAAVTEFFGQKPDSLCTIYQIHSAEVVTLEKPCMPKEAPQADAMITKKPGVMLGILTADCLPILFADARHGVIGAAHAGWKGAFSGVIENTLAAMQALGAALEDMVVAIGPGIAQGSYEVGAEFRERFLLHEEANQIYFIHGNRADHYLFDLKAYAKDRLKASGVPSINLLAEDTCLQEDDFFSYRRATLRSEPAYGRQVSAIILEE
jgi:YfiH family protein